MSERKITFGSPVDWSGNDLTDSLVIMQPVPRIYFDSLYDRKDPEFAEYLKEFYRDIQDTIDASGLDGFSKDTGPSYYLVPPAAGPYSDFIFTLAKDFNSVVNSIDAYISLGSVLIPLIRNRRKKDKTIDEQGGVREWRTGLYVGLRVAESMCLYHAYVHYYDPSSHPRITLDSYSRGEHVGALEHPSQGTHYGISVRVGSTAYIYVMSATCKVFEHFSIENGQVVGLERPKWPEDDDSYSVETIKYPTQRFEKP